MTPGDQLGPYRLLEAAPVDSEGPLWLATEADGTLVHLEICADDDPSFASESQLRADLAFAEKLRHPNLARILDAGIDGGHRYVATEFIEGLRLPALVDGLHRAGRTFPAWAAAYLMHGMAVALRHVHTRPGPDGQPLQTIGRPVHPNAIAVTRTGGVKLATLVTLRRAPREVSGEDPAAGYQSPEAIAALPLDGRSDLFGLGVLAWELVTDRPLFRQLPDRQRSEAILDGEIPALPAGVPRLLRDAIYSCLARRPEDRMQSADMLVAQLVDALQQPEASADETRRLVALANSFVTPVRAATAALLDDTKIADTRQSQPGGVADASEVLFPGSDSPVTPSSTRHPGDPFFDAIRDADGIVSDRFEVLGRLGSGGMGEVYRVRDRELDEVVALKMLPRSGPVEANSLDRLRREVRLARRIASDHVCRIFDIVDVGDGARGLTMAVVDGTTLSELIKSGLPLDYGRFAKWGAQIASGLAAAHQLEIVHRDLKPENVMIRIEDDRAVILDFGIARLQSDSDEQDPRLTQRGIIMGTPMYMSPEQLGNGSLDGRSDLYALGLILAELITGRVPRSGRNYNELLKRRAFEPEAYDLRGVDPNVPDGLAEVINHLLASAADERPASAEAVIEPLRQQAPDESWSRISKPAILAERAAGDTPGRTIPSVAEQRLLSEPDVANTSTGTLIALLIAALALVIVGIVLSWPDPAADGSAAPKNGRGNTDRRGGRETSEGPPPSTEGRGAKTHGVPAGDARTPSAKDGRGAAPGTRREGPATGRQAADGQKLRLPQKKRAPPPPERSKPEPLPEPEEM